MPDDDYEEISVGVALDINKAKQINALLDFIDGHITKVKEDNFEVYAAVKNLTKILRLMNGIE